MYGEKLRELRNLEGWTQEEVAKKIGVSKQTYSHYENEKRTPSLETIRKLAVVYGVNIDYVFGEEEKNSDEINEKPIIYSAEPVVKLPIVGKISCGNGTVALEDIEGYEDTPRDWLNGGEYFYLRAKGDSMINARIMDGDLLLIRRQEEVENGEIAAVVIDGDAVLKRVYKNNDTLILQSENPKYQPILCNKNNTDTVRIVGKLKKVVLNF